MDDFYPEASILPLHDSKELVKCLTRALDKVFPNPPTSLPTYQSYIFAFSLLWDDLILSCPNIHNPRISYDVFGQRVFSFVTFAPNPNACLTQNPQQEEDLCLVRIVIAKDMEKQFLNLSLTSSSPSETKFHEQLNEISKNKLHQMILLLQDIHNSFSRLNHFVIDNFWREGFPSSSRNALDPFRFDLPPTPSLLGFAQKKLPDLWPKLMKEVLKNATSLENTPQDKKASTKRM